MSNIDDTRTVYDGIKIRRFDECNDMVVRGGWEVLIMDNGTVIKSFDYEKQAEKFREDLIRFVEGYK